MTSPADLLDLERWPVVGPGRGELVSRARDLLADDGIVVLGGFVRPAALERLVAESVALVPQGHHSEVENTPYLSLPEDAFPDGHPRRHLVRSSLTAVAYDRFGAGSSLRSLYEWEPLAGFVRDVVGLDEIHRYAAVASVLDGSDEVVTHVRFEPGALMIFAGRHSMHRVTPIEGSTSRLVALLAYDSRPGTDSSELLKLVRYGRLPEPV